MLTRRRIASASLVAGAPLIAYGVWVGNRDARPFLRIDALPSMSRSLDTAIVLQKPGRYQLALELALPPGDIRGRFFSGPDLLAFEGSVGGKRWVSDSAAKGTHATGGESVGKFWQTPRAKPRDTIRLSLRAAPELATWSSFAPRVELQRSVLDRMYRGWAEQMLGLGLVVVGAVYWWRNRRRPVMVPAA